MKNTKITLLFLFTLFIQILSAQNRPELSFLQLSPTLMENARDIVREETKIFKVKSIKEGSIYHKKIVTILSEKSNENVLLVHYDKDSKVLKIQARLYDAGGNLVRKISNDEVQDFSAVASLSCGSATLLVSNSIRYSIQFQYQAIRYTNKRCLFSK